MKKTIAIKVQPDLLARVDELGKSRGTGRSAVFREALAQYLTHPGLAKSSFADRAADLEGCVKGAHDLSSSSHHLRGYGR